MKPKTTACAKFIALMAAIFFMVTAKAQNLNITYTVTPSCNSGGSILLNVSGGTSPYTFTLYGNFNTTQTGQSSASFSGLPTGYYNVSVVDASGLNGYDSIYVAPAFRAYSYDSAAICPSIVGSDFVLVDSPQYAYTYQWSNGATTSTVYNVPLGSNYTCTVTKTLNGCTAVVSGSPMYQTSSIGATFTTTPANCNNGTSTVIPSGGLSPYTYMWSNGQTGVTATGLSGQYYLVTVTDAQGCSAEEYSYIQQGIVISTQTSYTAENCNNDDGSATITALNGTAPFTYIWSTGQTNSHISGLSTSDYSVTVTDAMGCTASDYVYVPQTTPIIASASSVNTSCTTNNGKATITASGGTAPYSYVWTSSPVQNTATATGLGVGYYYVTVTDAQSCLQTAYVYVADSGTLSMNLSTVNPVCGVLTGSAAANAAGGTAPYHYIWNTGATTATISGITQSECLYCTVTDNIGCVVSQNSSVISLSPINLSFSATNASCIYTADGTASVTASGGTAPYTYSWSNGQNTATSTGVLTGYQYVYVTDANQCAQGGYVFVGYNSILPCAVSISGTVVNDYNSDCIMDGPDYGLQNVWVGCFPNGGWQWTNQNGAYDFILPPGAYSVVESPPLYHTLICPTTSPIDTLTAGQSNSNYNFYNKPDSVYDLTIATIPYQLPVAGFTQQIDLFIGNLGNFSVNPDVVYMHSLSEVFLGSTPSPDTYDPTTGRISWNLSLLAANGISVITMDFNIPSSLATGYILNNTDTVYPIVGDNDTFNNYESYIGNVVRSYDPNYIDVTPTGTGAPGYISAVKDSVLQYVVHFQNTGNYEATDVKLQIPIDTNLDISTFRLIGTSLPYYYSPKISADKNRILTIDFPNIYLPDSFASRLGSQGFAAFTFKKLRGLAPGTEIHENANIYFDYNSAVPTNKTLNTIEFPAGIRTISSDANFSLYPNPTQDNVTLDLSALNESRVEVHIYDMMGRVALDIPATNISGSKQLSISTSGLAAGVYSVEVTGSANYVQKLVKTDK